MVREDPLCRVWCGGLPRDISEKEIEDRYSDFGEVTEVRIHITERDTFCFVQYKKQEAADYAIKEMNQTTFHGKRIKVNLANTSPAKGGGKGGGGGGRRGSRSRSRRRGSPSPRRNGGGRPPSRRRSRSRRRSPSPKRRSPPPGRPRTPPRKRSASPPKRSPPRRSPPRRSPPRRSPPRRSPPKRSSRSRSRGDRRDDKDRRGGRQSGGQVEEGAHKVTVENLPPDMSWHELKDLGRSFGSSLTFARTYKNRDGDYCGMVEFKYRDDADNTVRELDRRRVEGSSGRLRCYLGDGSKDGRDR